MHATRPLRLLVVLLPAVLLPVALGSPAAASAAVSAAVTGGAPVAGLAVTSLSRPPAAVAPGARFVLKGRVANSLRRASGARITFSLRPVTGAGPIRRLAGSRTLRIGARSSRVYSVRVTVPASAAGRSYTVRACVRRVTSRQAACRSGARVRVTGKPAASGTPTNPQGQPPVPAGPQPDAPVVPPVDPVPFTPGARSLGDSLFPDIGGGGYNAQHYALDLDYVIATKTLGGTSTATLKATQDLSRLTMDFAPWLRVSSVTIDGAPVSFRQGAATPATLGGADYDYDLDITPAAPGIRDGRTFDVAVTYSGVTKPVIDPDGAQDGWIPDPVFGAIAVSEPIGAMGWFPDNNVPFDKATFTISMSVPDDGIQALLKPWVVVGTGVLRAGSPTIADGKRTYVWETGDPTAPYLASVSIARFDFVPGTSTDPPVAPNTTVVPFYTAIDSGFLPNAKAAQLTDLDRTSSILDFYAGYYDLPYPFDAQGGINPQQSVGYSLETQGKPTYAVNASPASPGAGLDTIAHENGHMYFGDYVTLTRWKDIWLNEGMTEFSTWLWSASQDGGPSLASRFQATYATTESDFWLIPTAAPPTGADIFDYNAMYVRGATTMVAIHEILGDAAFRTLMHDWLTAPGHPYGNATTEEFIALVKAHDPTHAARWDTFFQEWLYTSYPGTPGPGNRPQVTPSNFLTA